MGRYRDIDIHLNLKGCSPGLSPSVRSDVDSLSFEANRIIQGYIERYQLQGWRTEGSTDFLSLFEERRLTYRAASVSKPARFISARVTLCKDANRDNSEQIFSGSFTVSARVKRSQGSPLARHRTYGGRCGSLCGHHAADTQALTRPATLLVCRLMAQAAE